MTPTALAKALEKNSRQAEKHLRQAEEALYKESDQETRLEHLIASKLSEIAGLQLEANPAQDQHTRQLLEQRELERTALGQQLEQVERSIASSLAKQQAIRQDLGQLDAKAQALLEQDPAHHRLLEQLDAADLAERQAQAGYAEIRDECASKLQGYATHPLYCFLKARQYGTEQYRPKLFQRALDDYLARKVDFRVNHANEQILLAMQARNETLAQTLAEARQQLQAQHQQQLDKARETLGMQASMTQEQDLDTLLGEAKAQASALHAQLAAFNEQRDPHLQQLRQAIGERLKERPLAELIVEAAKTPDERDDVLVGDLQLLHARLRELQQRLKAARDEAAGQRRLYERAKTLEYALRDDHYRDPSNEYELPQPIEQVLAGYMQGQFDTYAVQKLLDENRQYVPLHRRGDARNHQWGTASTYTSGDFAGSRSSSSSTFHTSSSSGGGGFKTTHSSGGGGFRTTDSF